jgi:hypothetical protein
MTPEFKVSRILEVNESIALTSISPEATDLLEKIMEEWEKHFTSLKEMYGDKYEPSFYGFAYWLVRYSGLIQPANK